MRIGHWLISNCYITLAMLTFQYIAVPLVAMKVRKP